MQDGPPREHCSWGSFWGGGRPGGGGESSAEEREGTPRASCHRTPVARMGCAPDWQGQSAGHLRTWIQDFVMERYWSIFSQCMPKSLPQPSLSLLRAPSYEKGYAPMATDLGSV